jgi:solute carrier family 25 protein 39/40
VSPLELLRTKAMHRRSELSMLGTLRDEVRRGGVGTLWRGLGPTLARDVPFSGIYWLGYERLKRWGAGRLGGGGGGSSGGGSGGSGGGGAGSLSSAWGVSFLSGLAAGSFAALVTTPFDVVKTRRQVHDGASPPRAGTLAALLDIVRAEGPAGIFSGVSMRVARVGPACAIMISCYEVTKLVLLKEEPRVR